MPRYDESVIQEHAQTLYDRADALVLYAAASGLVTGLLAGGILYLGQRAAGLNLGAGWVLGVPAVWFAVIAGVRAEREAFRLRLEAQTALCQVMIQRNTAATRKRFDQLADVLGSTAGGARKPAAERHENSQATVTRRPG